MGWFTKDKEIKNVEENKESQNEPVLTNYSKGQKILMQDKPPRFDPESSASASATSPSGMMKNAIDTLRWDDFSLASLTEVPCFRDAGMVGFSSMFILGSITLLYHKNPIKATNWATGGLLLGSIVGWEQCRMKRKKSMEISTMAMQTMQERKRKEAIKQGLLPTHKEKKEISPEKLKEIELLKKEWESHPNDSSYNLNNNKSWYKFW